MIEVQQLRYAVKAADERSFARAAMTFNMKQSTLSRKVLRLEDQLGLRLFNRTTRGAFPTDQAMPFIEAARQIIDDLDGLQRRALALRGGQYKRLALGYSSSLFTGNLTRSLRTFLKTYPDIQFDGFERSPQQLFAALRSGLVDAVIAPSSLSSLNFVKMPLWPERVRVCFSSSHKLSSIDPIRWNDLKQEHIVLPADGLGRVIRDLLVSQLGNSSGNPDVSFQETSSDNIFGLVSITEKATLTTQAVPSQLADNLHCRDVHDPTGLAQIDFALHWCRDNSNPALRHLRDILREDMATRWAPDGTPARKHESANT